MLYVGHYTASPRHAADPCLAIRVLGWRCYSASPGWLPPLPGSTRAAGRPSRRGPSGWLRRHLHVVVDGASLLDVSHLPNV